MRIPVKAIVFDSIMVLISVVAIISMNNYLKVSDYEVVSAKLPEAFNGCSIAQVSDFHSMDPETVASKLRKINPDYIFLTGDYINDDDAGFDKIVELAQKIKDIAPSYAVSGNHDIWHASFIDLRSSLESAGVIWLDDITQEISLNGQAITVSGAGDPYSWNDEEANLNLEHSLNGLTPEADKFNILLFHRSNMLDKIGGRGYDLTFSGHLHGGQIRIPFVGGLYSPHREFFPAYSGGQYVEGDTTMIVSAGIYDLKALPRVFNPPEIVMVTLKKA